MLSQVPPATQQDCKRKLIVLLGPTAVGKTAYSLEIAKQFNCEIISGDSMQVYREMNIGTAKATAEERADVPHHLIDIKNPDEPFSVAEFMRLANDAIIEISERGRVPLLVGGTGLYIESLCYGFELNPIEADEEYRQHLMHYASVHGAQALHDQLQKIDSTAAARLHPNDQRRIIRALEIYKLTGQTKTDQLRSDTKEAIYDLCLIGLTMDRSILYKRIEERVDHMLEQGLLAEVSSLLSQGYTVHNSAMQAIGYKEIIPFVFHEYDWNTAVKLLKRNTRRYAKRQLSWFRRMKDVHWLDVTHSANFHSHLASMHDIIQGKDNTR